MRRSGDRRSPPPGCALTAGSTSTLHFCCCGGHCTGCLICCCCWQGTGATGTCPGTVTTGHCGGRTTTGVTSCTALTSWQTTPSEPWQDLSLSWQEEPPLWQEELSVLWQPLSAREHIFSVDAANPGEGETCVVRCQPWVQLSLVRLEVYWGSAGFACLSIPFPLLGASFPQCRIIPHHLNTLTTPPPAAPIPISAGLRGSFPCSPLLHPMSTPSRHPGIIVGLRNGGGDAPGAASLCCTGKRHLGKGLRNSQPPGALAQAVNLQPGLVVLEPQKNTLLKPGAQNEEIPVPSSLLVSSAPSVPHGPLAGQWPVS